MIATHWDKQTSPYGENQNAFLEQAETFVSEVKKVSPKSKIIVPKHFETVRV